MRLAPLVAAVFLVAYGGAAMSPASPSPAPAKNAAPTTLEREPSTIDEATQQLAQARAVLEPEHDEQAGGQPPHALDSASSECEGACRAIASMRRAVDALCRLAGDTDDRCTDARATLSRCETRVAKCGC
jgi:hypothetical protein